MLWIAKQITDIFGICHTVGTVVSTSVFGHRTFPGLHPIYG